MAIDFEKAMTASEGLIEGSTDLRNLIEHYKDGKIVVDGLGKINLSTSQKQLIIDKYIALKTKLVNHYNDLP